MNNAKLNHNEYLIFKKMIKDFLDSPLLVARFFFLLITIPTSLASFSFIFFKDDNIQILTYWFLSLFIGVSFFIITYILFKYLQYKLSRNFIDSTYFCYYFGIVTHKGVNIKNQVQILVDYRGHKKFVVAYMPKKLFNKIEINQKVIVMRGLMGVNFVTIAYSIEDDIIRQLDGNPQKLLEIQALDTQNYEKIPVESLEENYGSYLAELNGNWHRMSDIEKNILFCKCHVYVFKLLTLLLLGLYVSVGIFFINISQKDIFFTTTQAMLTGVPILLIIIILMSVATFPYMWTYYKLKKGDYDYVEGILIKTRSRKIGKSTYESLGTVCYYSSDRYVEEEYVINTHFQKNYFKFKKAGSRVWIIRDTKKKKNRIYCI